MEEYMERQSYSIYGNISTTPLPRNTSQQGVCEKGAQLSLENVLYVNLLAAILICCVVGNTFVIVAGFMSRRLKNHVTTCFIISLACSDLLISSFGVPFRIATKIYGQQFCYHISVCYIAIILDAIGNMASIFNLLLLAIDRFTAIRLPYKYIDYFTKRRCKQMVLLVWLYSLIWAIVGMFHWETGPELKTISIVITKYRNCTNLNRKYYATSFAIYLVIFVIITCTYFTILNIALRQIKSIKRDERATSRLISAMSVDSESERIKKTKWRNLNRELKATKSIAIVYIAFVVCWMPSAVINIIIMFDAVYFLPMQKENKKLFLFIFYLCVQILPVFNTMLNPIIYSFSNQHFRSAFKKLAGKLVGQKIMDRRISSQMRKGKKASLKLIGCEKSRNNTTSM